MTHEKDVFINCPFDAKYRPLLRGLVFAVHDCDSYTRCVVLDNDEFRYQSFCSDIAGQDIRAHSGKVAAAIEIVRNWLSTTPPAQGTVIPSGSVIAGRYKQFRIALPGGCEKLQLNSRRLTFGDDVTLIVGWLKENPWKPAVA